MWWDWLKRKQFWGLDFPPFGTRETTFMTICYPKPKFPLEKRHTIKIICSPGFSLKKGKMANSVDSDKEPSHLDIPVFTAIFFGLPDSVAQSMRVRLMIRRSRARFPSGPGTFFPGDWSWNIFYGHSFPSADSRRAVIPGFLAKECRTYWLTA